MITIYSLKTLISAVLKQPLSPSFCSPSPTFLPIFSPFSLLLSLFCFTFHPSFVCCFQGFPSFCFPFCYLDYCADCQNISFTFTLIFLLITYQVLLPPLPHQLHVWMVMFLFSKLPQDHLLVMRNYTSTM